MIIKSLPAPTAIYWRVLALIGFGWLLAFIVIFNIREAAPPFPFAVGLIIGTLFQLTVLAAAFGALGPGKLLWRIPLSLVWAWFIGSAFALPEFGERDGPQVVTVFLLIITALWAIALTILWLATVVFGLHLRYQAEPRDANSAPERQFGIGQLMIFTAFIAVLAAIGRLILSSKLIPDPDQEFILMISMIVVTQILISLPLIFSGLLQQRVALATVLALVLVTTVTVVEQLTVRQLMTRGIPREEFLVLFWTNFHSALWVLAFTAIVRGSGYRFGWPKPEQGIQYVGPLREHEPRQLPRAVPEKSPEIVFLPPAAATPAVELPQEATPSDVIHIQE